MTRDVETRNLQSGSIVGSFGVAVNRKYKTSGGDERDDVMFIDCEAWNKAAEILAQYTKKGDPIFLAGRLALDEWEAQDGTKRRKHKLVVDQFQFIGGRDDQAAPRDNGNQTNDRPRQQTRGPSQRPSKEQVIAEDAGFRDADVPFSWHGRDEQLI
jgi:single-strand DNA-binding protein